MRILIATDGSKFSRAAVEKACELVTPKRDRILCFSCFDDAVPIGIDPAFVSSEYYQHVADGVREVAETNVKDAESQIRSHFSTEDVEVATETANGFADKLIIDKAVDWKADMIVVGSHGRGFWGRLLGSVSNGVVNHAPCSVLVVRHSPEAENDRS